LLNKRKVMIAMVKKRNLIRYNNVRKLKLVIVREIYQLVYVVIYFVLGTVTLLTFGLCERMS